MIFHKDTGDSLEPCKHMESMLNRTAEGSAPRLMRWYAESHAARCGRCGRFLRNVRALIGRLKGINEETCAIDERLSPQRWESVEAGWEETEKEQAAER